MSDASDNDMYGGLEGKFIKAFKATFAFSRRFGGERNMKTSEEIEAIYPTSQPIYGRPPIRLHCGAELHFSPKHGVSQPRDGTSKQSGILGHGRESHEDMD